MKQIGKGSFTTAYRKDSRTVILKSIDPIKECMSEGMFPNSRFFPKISRLNYGEVSTYEMKYYNRVAAPKRQLKPLHYQYYKELRRIRVSSSFLEDLPKLRIPSYLKRHLEDAYNACRNYDYNTRFEVSPRNIAESNGNLVLLDCFYSSELLNKIGK